MCFENYDNILLKERGEYMESLTSAINVQVNAKDKELATSILKDLGLNMSTFINMALIQVVKRNGVPFEVVGLEVQLMFLIARIIWVVLEISI